MGIYGALATAVSGLSAQAFSLENISGNIANVQTTGFKRVDTSFVDMVNAETSVQRQNSGSVIANSRATNSVQGDVQASQVGTHAAINGQGYFVVQEKTGETDGRAVFGGVDFFTRRGDFILDDEGYLVNGSGYYLKSLPIDQTTGAVAGSVPELVTFQSDFLPAEATTEITYRANLASLPITVNYDDQVPGSHVLNPAGFTADPTTAGGGFVQAADEQAFMQSSIAGGAVTAYEGVGAPVNIQMRWAKIDDAITGTNDTWNLFYLEDSTATGAAPMWRNVGQDYTFNNLGQLNPAVPNINIPALTVDGVNLGNIQLTHGLNGLTQFNDSNGNASITTIAQDGLPAGELVKVSMSNGGYLTASYDNGQTRNLAEIPLASFLAENALSRKDGGAFVQTYESGAPVYNDAGQILAQSLEGSNTDISDEFTKLIVTQQAYSANSRIISTSDEMLQEVLSILR
ncbi:MAG: flagellar hook-basal body complex protein [Pseudomonadota bacterium]